MPAEKGSQYASQVIYMRALVEFWVSCGCPKLPEVGDSVIRSARFISRQERKVVRRRVRDWVAEMLLDKCIQRAREVYTSRLRQPLLRGEVDEL
jgi:hypothetical protein